MVSALEVFFLDDGTVSSKMCFLGDGGRGLNYSEETGALWPTQESADDGLSLGPWLASFLVL